MQLLEANAAHDGAAKKLKSCLRGFRKYKRSQSGGVTQSNKVYKDVGSMLPPLAVHTLAVPRLRLREVISKIYSPRSVAPFARGIAAKLPRIQRKSCVSEGDKSYGICHRSLMT